MHSDTGFALQRRQELDVLASLRAGRQNEFVPYLQPKVCLVTRKTVGYEALLRWLPFPGVLLSPGLTIPAIEAGGMIHDVWVMMLRQVCILQRQRIDAEGCAHPISVNLPPALLNDPLLCANASSIAAHHGVPANTIEFEIVEHAKISDLDTAARAVEDLRASGFSVTLDDFGIGFASLLHLAHLPVAGIKLDRSFLYAPKGALVMAGIVGLCRSMGMFVVVEGIETDSHVSMAMECGAHYGQGFLFARPRHADEVWCSR